MMNTNHKTPHSTVFSNLQQLTSPSV